MPELLQEVRVRMASEEFGEVGFTNEDRKLLITLSANFGNLERSVERRLALLESERAHKEDVHRIERDLRSDLAEKADRSELSGSAVMQLKAAFDRRCDQIDRLDKGQVWVYAFSAGMAFTGSGLVAVLMHFWK
jgi:hypothetical protein